MICYICNSEMKFIEELDVKMIGKSKKYKCEKCGEIVYKPLNAR